VCPPPPSARRCLRHQRPTRTRKGSAKSESQDQSRKLVLYNIVTELYFI
jgi:hypothetical protein